MTQETSARLKKTYENKPLNFGQIGFLNWLTRQLLRVPSFRASQGTSLRDANLIAVCHQKAQIYYPLVTECQRQRRAAASPPAALSTGRAAPRPPTRASQLAATALSERGSFLTQSPAPTVTNTSFRTDHYYRDVIRLQKRPEYL